MREIEFRGQRKDSKKKEWVYGSLIQTKEGVYILPKNSSIHDMCFIEVYPDTVGEYINIDYIEGGIKQKIYEGDNVHCYGGEYDSNYGWEVKESVDVSLTDIEGLYDIFTSDNITIIKDCDDEYDDNEGQKNNEILSKALGNIQEYANNNNGYVPENKVVEGVERIINDYNLSVSPVEKEETINEIIGTLEIRGYSVS